LNNRNIRVNEAEERAPRPTGFSGGGHAGPPPFSPFGKKSKSKGSRRNIRGRKRGF
jgi:hypothetical protein